MARKLACIHGHFYQPPRENPWLEAVEVEDSAAPYHDWNARVNAECYAANAGARLLGAAGQISEVVSNYEAISFDFGPTLLSWMEEADPRTYAAVIEADRRSAEARGGHGNAVAHPYNHMILPLASPRDKVTQVRWGLADFGHRFGRKPEGFWLAETAVDGESLEVLADHDIAFTILAPHQAAAVRPIEEGAEWKDVGSAGIDPTRPYRCTLPSGRSIAIFFYDGPISRAIAFEGLLADGAALARRVAGAFVAGRSRDQLVHVATDGESYGHHHRFGDMALAYAARALPEEHGVELTNYAAFLAEHPPTHEARIAERTSWSCSHGVGRWSADCGCRFDSRTSQAWRAPLRAALDWLRDQVDALFEKRGAALLKEPWAARDDYVGVLLERASPDAASRFLEAHGVRKLDHFERVEALSLLEMERNRMLMYTSCGWFFDDPAGLEAVQILKYAARAIQLAAGLGKDRLERRFETLLAKLVSNDPAAGDGRQIYRERVKPSVVDLRRVVAHHAITSLFGAEAPPRRIFNFHVDTLDWAKESYGATRLAVGRVRVRSARTFETEDLSFGLLHFGGHDFNCSLRGTVSAEGYAAMRDELLETFESKSLTDVVHALDRHFEGRYFGLPDIFLEGRRAVLGTVTSGVLEELEDYHERFYDEHRKLFDYLRGARFPLPAAFRRTVELALTRRVLVALAQVGKTDGPAEPAIAAFEEVVDEVARREVVLAEDAVAPALTAAVERLATTLVRSWSSAEVMAARRLLAASTRLAVKPQLWGVQNAVLAAMRKRPPEAGGPPRHDVTDLLTDLGIDPTRLR